MDFLRLFIKLQKQKEKDNFQFHEALTHKNKFYIISNIQGDKLYAGKKLSYIRYYQRRKNRIN